MVCLYLIIIIIPRNAPVLLQYPIHAVSIDVHHAQSLSAPCAAQGMAQRLVLKSTKI